MQVTTNTTNDSVASRERNRDRTPSATNQEPSSSWKLDSGEQNSALSNYFPARSLTKSSVYSIAQWEPKVVTYVNPHEPEAQSNQSMMTNTTTTIKHMPFTPYQTPLNSDRRSAKETLRTLDDQLILKTVSADDHNNVSSINLSGQIFKNVDTENFEMFTSCAFIQASRTEGTINLDTFDKLENLADLEINMSGISILKQPRPNWDITILDLSYNSLSESASQNFEVLSCLPKLRVLNVSGNDLLNFGDSGEPIVFESLQLLIAEDNNLSADFFRQISNEVNMPNLKVLLLDYNRIQNIPKLESVSSSLEKELHILSLAGNPIKSFEQFSNVLQFSNLSVLKLQDTPFVRTTSKNPKVVDESGIIVERHFPDDIKKSSRKGKKKSEKNLPMKIAMRKIAEPKRPKRDKTWFFELIENLEKRVKYEVRSAILGDLDSDILSEREIKQKTEKSDVDKQLIIDDPLTGNPVFLTELEHDNEDAVSMRSSASEQSTSTIVSEHPSNYPSEISDTITDMSILNGSESDSRGLVTPPLPMSDTVKRLKMAYQKQTMIHQNHGLTKFPYKVSTNKSTKTLDLVSKHLQSSEQRIIGNSLKSMRNQKASTKTTLNLEKRASDSALYEDLNTEYNKLRDEITKMSIDPEIEPKIKNSQ